MIWKLRISRELIGDRVVIRGLWLRIRREMQQSRVIQRLLIPTLMIDEATEVGSELRPKGAIGIDEHGLSLLVKQVVLAPIDIVAA